MATWGNPQTMRARTADCIYALVNTHEKGAVPQQSPISIVQIGHRANQRCITF